MARAANMARYFIGNAPGGMVSVKGADTLDDRISIVMDEIEDGKRDKDISMLVSDVLSEVPERDWKGEVEAIFNFVRANVRYTRDPAGVELFQKPIRTLQYRRGDCDDMTMLLGAMLQNAGYNIVLRVVGMSNNPEHIYLLALIPPGEDQQYIALDPSRSEPAGWEIDQKLVKFRQDYEFG